MAMKRMILGAALAGGAAALATVKPYTPTSTICGIICTDGTNECGQRYGGCYDPCVDPVPTPPPCAPPYLSTFYPTPVPTPTISIEPYNCSTITVCVDGINSCGIPFGGCIPDCKPWNLVTPPCPFDDIATLPFSPFPWNPATETPIIEPILVTPTLEPLILGSPISQIPTVESPILVAPILESPIPATPTLESPIPVTPALETPVLETPFFGGAPVLGVPFAAGPVAEIAEVVEGSVPEAPLPWIPV